MKNPAPINLITTAQVKAAGWSAESRDADGHLLTTHAPFETQGEMLDYVLEETTRGMTVTIFPDPIRRTVSADSDGFAVVSIKPAMSGSASA
jgi:hypothetical protein